MMNEDEYAHEVQKRLQEQDQLKAQCAVWGPASAYSDHKTGETVRFREGRQEKEGRIIHVMAPGITEGGIAHGVRYVVEVRQKGFPSIVAPGDVIG